MNVSRLLRTLFYIKPIQIVFQLKYRLYQPKYKQLAALDLRPLHIERGVTSSCSFDNCTFIFLNQTVEFEDINWNYNKNGKLWCYNLNYFDFLKQEDISKEQGLSLINDFIDKVNISKDGLEPYPTSLRGMNWVRFLSNHHISDKKINDSLYSQFHLLSRKLEYHLLGNHLLENGFALLWGALFFNDLKFYRIACKILKKELKEQVLADGAHFELSPMYHCIMMERTLDAYALVKKNSGLADELLPLLKDSSEKMLSWLEQICVGDSFPLFNDSAEGIASEPKELIKYATNLGLKTRRLGLGDSGYRRLESQFLCLIADVGEVGPSYIPGHAHADMLSFVLYHKHQPIIVDSGTSTYEWGGIRNFERGTAAHNIVQIDGEEQSEVWGSHRVGRRAEVEMLKDNTNRIKAQMVGFSRNRKKHLRSFYLEADFVRITDEVENAKNAIARLHFHPNVNIVQRDETWLINELSFLFSGAENIRLIDYEYGVGFNKRQPAQCLEIKFGEKLETEISSLIS
ncbi:heparinase II/III family protein [Ancylomarina sp. DW003]|nr:alginate lyase family protein [Ancylomarina sp. DW003]MDE5421920.1 heparinase II/III family protein [Ancylomarina sp. DW003]